MEQKPEKIVATYGFGEEGDQSLPNLREIRVPIQVRISIFIGEG